MVEMYEHQDNGRRIVPLHTGKVQIGRAYVPKPKFVDAQWFSVHKKQTLLGRFWTALWRWA